jgi:hypothetical protein
MPSFALAKRLDDPVRTLWRNVLSPSHWSKVRGTVRVRLLVPILQWSLCLLSFGRYRSTWTNVSTLNVLQHIFAETWT